MAAPVPNAKAAAAVSSTATAMAPPTASDAVATNPKDPKEIIDQHWKYVVALDQSVSLALGVGAMLFCFALSAGEAFANTADR